MILFLDYDGVLHPDSAYLVKGRPVLKTEGELFMWVPLLVEALAERPHVQIVLSTSWARQFGFYRARRWLPVEIQPRVIGATWHSRMGRHQEAEHRLGSTWWDEVDRYQQIRRYVNRAGLGNDWLAVDDQPGDWSNRDLDNLVYVDGDTGLSDADAFAKLDKLLSVRQIQMSETDTLPVNVAQQGGV